MSWRVAVAAGPSRTTLWTSLRFTAAGGKMGIVVPAPPGTSLDISSDAWFEALEVATAPRVFPPGGSSFYCPGRSGPANATPNTPFAGTIGNALAEPGLHSVVPPRQVGGNMDIRDLSAGVTLYLPVEVDGALRPVPGLLP